MVSRATAARWSDRMRSTESGNARPSRTRPDIQLRGPLGVLARCLPALPRYTSRLVLWIVAALMLAACGGAAGAGEITFGSQINDQTLDLIGGEKATFTTSDTFAWRAVLSQPAGASSLRLVIAKKNGSTEVTQTDEQLSVSNPDFNVLGNELPMSTLATSLDGPGTYVMRVLREGTKLAEGEFTLR